MIGSTTSYCLIMNVIIWNSRGALKPNFQSHVRKLTQDHDPAIFVVMETRLGGVRAREITDQLPFDNAIHIDTIGYAGGLWLLWNSDRVDITLLSKTKQEIHATALMSALICATCWIWASRGQDSPGQTEGMLMCSFKRELIVILLIRIGVQYVWRLE